MRPRRILIGVAVASCLAIVTACGSTSTGSTGSSGAAHDTGASSADLANAEAGAAAFLAAPTSILQTVPLPTAPPSGMTLVMVGTSEPTNVQVQQAIKAGAAALGWKFAVVDYDPANPATLQAAFTTALTKHPVAVVEAGTPQYEIGASVLAAYANAHVPVVISGAYPFTPSKWIIGDPDGYANDARMGVALADWFVADSKGTGKVIMEHAPGYPILDGFTNAFSAQVTKLCPGCSIKMVDVTLPQLAAGQTVSVATSVVKANPSYKYLFFDDGDFAIGVNSALSAAGLTGIKIGGQALDAEGAAALQAGTQSAWTGYSGYYQGYGTVDVIARFVEHAPGAGSDTLQPTQLLTPGNIEKTTTWNVPANALAQFEKLWKVPVTSCALACG